MAVSAKLYGKFFNTLASNAVDLDGDTLKAMLCTSSYTPNQDTHEYKSDVTSEITGTGYTAGGAALTGVSISYTGASNTWALDADDLTWTSSTLTARYLVLYDTAGGADTARRLIGYVDFGADVSTTSGTLTVSWATGGIVSVVVT